MTNLPPLSFQSIAEYNVSVEIEASIEQVWGILSDIDSYPLWNPFLRSAVIVDASSHNPTEDHTLLQGATLELAMQFPPGLNTTKKPTVGYEYISVVDRPAHRLVWGGGRIPSLFRAEQALALFTTPDGNTRYEARNAFGGVSGYAIKCFMGSTTQACLQAMGDALKQRAEARSS